MREKSISILLFLCVILSFCTFSFPQPAEEKMRVAVVEFGEKGDLRISNRSEVHSNVYATRWKKGKV